MPIISQQQSKANGTSCLSATSTIDQKPCRVKIGQGHITGIWQQSHQLPIYIARKQPPFTLSMQWKLVPQDKKVVIICPLILLRHTPEEVMGGGVWSGGGLSFLEINLDTSMEGLPLMKSLKLPGFHSLVFDWPGNLAAANFAFLALKPSEDERWAVTIIDPKK